MQNRSIFMNKVLYIHGESAIGGAERDLLSILAGLNRIQFLPIVICPDKGPFYEKLIELGIKTIILKLPPWRKIRSFLKIPFVVLKLNKIIKREGIHLVHINDFWYIPVGWIASKMCKIPVIAHVRGSIEPRKVKLYWLSCPDFLITASIAIQKTIQNAGVNPKSITTIYAGLNLNQIPDCLDSTSLKQKLQFSDGDPIIGIVANVCENKGYDYLIDALSIIKKEINNIRCLVVGAWDEKYIEHLFTQTKKESVDKNIRFVGFQENVYPYLSIMDIFVFPSLTEGFGIALLEAMAMQKPVIATNIGGIPEIVDDGITGILIPPKDPKAIARAVVGLLNDRELKTVMGRQGAQKVRSYFSLINAIDQLQNVYATLLSERSIL